MTQDTPRGTSPIDIGAALANPSAHFAQPQDVLAYPGLSRELQLELLRQWEQDARGLAEAETEGMGGGEENMLGRVHQALRALDRPQEISMNDIVAGEAPTSMGAAARNVAGGLREAASPVQHAASLTQGSVTAIREVIRAQPITAALLMFAFGYLFGRLGSLIPSGGQRRRYDRLREARVGESPVVKPAIRSRRNTPYAGVHQAKLPGAPAR